MNPLHHANLTNEELERELRFNTDPLVNDLLTRLSGCISLDEHEDMIAGLELQISDYEATIEGQSEEIQDLSDDLREATNGS